MDTSSSTENQLELKPERQKPGPKKGDSKKLERTLDELITRIHNLEGLVIRMAHQGGISHSIIKEAGLEAWSPSKKDMSKRVG